MRTPELDPPDTSTEGLSAMERLAEFGKRIEDIAKAGVSEAQEIEWTSFLRAMGLGTEPP